MIKIKYSREEIGFAFIERVTETIQDEALIVSSYFDYYSIKHRGYAVLVTVKSRTFNKYDDDAMFYYSYLQDEFPAVIIDLPLSDEELIRHIDIKERNREMRNNLITMRSMA